MTSYIPETMTAVAFDHYGDPEVLEARTLPVPRPGRGEVLIRLESCGIGVWDAELRTGAFELGEPASRLGERGFNDCAPLEKGRLVGALLFQSVG